MSAQTGNSREKERGRQGTDRRRSPSILIQAEAVGSKEIVARDIWTASLVLDCFGSSNCSGKSLRPRVPPRVLSKTPAIVGCVQRSADGLRRRSSPAQSRCSVESVRFFLGVESADCRRSQFRRGRRLRWRLRKGFRPGTWNFGPTDRSERVSIGHF